MLDELAHAGPEHLDEAFVEGYDRKQGYPEAGEDLAILEAAGLGTQATVVDFAAGTGQFALPAARRFGRVVAVDVSPVMIRMLEERAAERGLTNLSCVRAGFLSYVHEGDPADAIYTRNALHQLPDFWKAMALHRMASLLRSGGLVRIHDLIYDFEPSQAEERLRHWMAHAVTDPSAGYTAADFAEHIRTEHSTFRWLFEPMLEAAGFEIVTVAFGGSTYGAYTCVKR